MTETRSTYLLGIKCCFTSARRLCLHLGVSVSMQNDSKLNIKRIDTTRIIRLVTMQTVFMHSTPEDLRREVRWEVRTLSITFLSLRLTALVRSVICVYFQHIFVACVYLQHILHENMQLYSLEFKNVQLQHAHVKIV